MLFFSEWGTLSSSQPLSPVFSGSHCLQDQVQTLCPEIQGLPQAGSRRPYQQCFSTALHCELSSPVKLICAPFPALRHTWLVPRGQRMAASASGAFGPRFLPCGLPLASLKTHPLLNPMYTSKPYLGRILWPSKSTVTSSFSAPWWYSVLVPLWRQLQVVIQWCLKALGRR